MAQKANQANRRVGVVFLSVIVGGLLSLSCTGELTQSGETASSMNVNATSPASATGKGLRYWALNDALDIKSFEVTQEIPEAPRVPIYRMKRGDTAHQTALIARTPIAFPGAKYLVVETVSSTALDAWDDSALEGPGLAVDAYAHVAAADRYYRTNHTWASSDNSGRQLRIDLRDPTSTDNAAFLLGAFTFTFQGTIPTDATLPYAASYDVVVHEFQHGVTDSTLKLNYLGQPGAISEALSDIFGCFAEHHAAPNETSNVLVGEKSFEGATSTRRAIRSLADPSSIAFDTGTHKGPYADHMKSYYRWPSTQAGDFGGVHANSTIVSHAWYLMTVGGTNKTSNLRVENPIGWELSEHLWATFVFGGTGHAKMTFEDLARATISTARKMDRPYRSSDPTRTVACAWQAVGVLTEQQLDEGWKIDCNPDSTHPGPALPKPGEPDEQWYTDPPFRGPSHSKNGHAYGNVFYPEDGAGKVLSRNCDWVSCEVDPSWVPGGWTTGACGTRYAVGGPDGCEIIWQPHRYFSCAGWTGSDPLFCP